MRRLSAVRFVMKSTPSDEANPMELWPKTWSTISFKDSHQMEIKDSTRLLVLAIVSHDLAIVSFDRAIVAYPPSDCRHGVEVSPRASFSIRFNCGSLIAIICLF